MEGKKSSLSIIALVLTLLGCTSIIGVVLAIIDLTKKDGRNKILSKIAVGIFAFIIIIGIFAPKKDSEEETIQETTIEESVIEEEVEQTDSVEEEIIEEVVVEEKEEKTIYNVGDVYEDNLLRITYLKSYEFTDFSQYNQPKEGHKVICAEFEFENLGKTDSTIMYVDFQCYADGYEMQQSYAPEGTGIEFSLELSSGRKGIGVIAFEVPVDAQEIQIEYDLNVFTSDKVVFSY